MADRKDDAHAVMLRAMKVALSPMELERITENFERDFAGLDLKSLPEYQAFVDAIEKYRDAAVAHFDSEYQKQISSR
ncbi:MAG TPA: hypothetical protein ENH99_01770 [Candidatus Pacearchaeota archaeon]|nr:hypothetical protein [Candidatus Pacearchaeota archaeon]